MEIFSRILAWLSENEAAISALVGIGAIGGLVYAFASKVIGRKRAGGAESEGRPNRRAVGRERHDRLVAGGDGPSIAVMPFEPRSRRPEHEYLADQLTEDIIIWLARTPGFFVIARSSTFAYKGSSPDVRELGRDLGVGYVLLGSIGLRGEQLRVRVQLAETETGKTIWTEVYDRAIDQLGTLDDEVAARIVAELEPELTRAEVAFEERRQPQNIDAWTLYRQARSLPARSGWHEETLTKAAQLLRRALEIDPEFGLAHGYLALVLAFGRMLGLVRDRSGAREEAMAAVDAALRSAGSSGEVEGYVGCALVDLGEVERGVAILERAIEANPSNAQAWAAQGAALIRSGKFEAGVEKLAHAMKISPRDPRLAVWGSSLATGLTLLGRHAEALEEAQAALVRDDRLFLPYVVRSIVLGRMGRAAEARAAFESARRVQPGLSRQDLAHVFGNELIAGLDRLSEQ